MNNPEEVSIPVQMTTILPNGFEGWLAASTKLDLVWAAVAPILLAAMEHNRGEFSLEDIRVGLLSNRMHLWCVTKDGRIHAAVVTELVTYPQFTSLRVVLMAGNDHQQWQDLWPVIEKFAQLYGCKFIEALTRPGVERMFAKATGLREQYRMLSVAVTKGVLH